ncbi:hypothetical protein [Luteimonas sp. TWI1437]|uniref:hypothetical protein n=1 Tax=unclassified Luteimonas TaxID=2629088 RepID=UPI003208321C
MTQTNAAPTPPPATEQDLLPGDMLLMLSSGQLSTLIAWCGDSIYSHAAIVADQGDLIEAAASGVRRYPLAQRLVDTAEIVLLDAYRPLAHDGSPLDDADRASVLAKAESMLGIPYPVDALAFLGVVVAVRGKWPQNWLARIVVREALDHLIHDNPSHMICSEVVYRALAECDVQPVGRLAPRIVMTGPTHLPFPKIDAKALLEEVWGLLHPQRQQALAAIRAHLQTDPQAATPPLQGAPADAALRERANTVRDRLGLSDLPITTSVDDAGALLEEATPQTPARAIPHPNPKLVMPLDLASSPSHTQIGRLLQADTSP